MWQTCYLEILLKVVIHIYLRINDVISTFGSSHKQCEKGTVLRQKKENK